MTQLIIDTNPFLRLILNDIPIQADEVERLIKKAKKGSVELLIPQIIVFEIEYALSKYYKFPKNQIIDKLNSIISAPYFSIQDRDIFKGAIKIYQEKNLSLVDCFLITKSQDLGTPIFTFDKKLNNLT